MPWIEEPNEHHCAKPLFWSMKPVGSRWQCLECEQVWRVGITPYDEKIFTKEQVWSKS